MLRSSLPRRSLLLAPLVVALACGRPSPTQADARKLDDTKDAAVSESSEAQGKPKWKREPTPMPETFAGFPRPDLAALDGVWIVDADRPHRGVVWLVEDAGSKLTIVDRRGRERIHGITLSSPCALRLTDASGRAHARAVAQLRGRLIISREGSVAVSSSDGSLLACVGHRTYQIAADGRCRYTTEMLGVWSDPIEAEDACKLETVDGARVLTIAGQRLDEHDGVWLDEVAAAGVAKPAKSIEAALVVLNPPPAEQAGTGTETGGAAATSETEG